MVYYAQTKNMALSSYFKVGLFVTLWIFCCGNECPKEALLVPADPIVTQNTHIQFECSVPSCLTDLSSDIWFGMKHTRYAFEEQKRGSVNPSGRLLAKFNVNVTSSDASGVYFYHVSPAGLDDIETNSTVSFVKGPNGAAQLGAGQLGAGHIAWIIIAIVAITVPGILFTWFLYREKKFCFRTGHSVEEPMAPPEALPLNGITTENGAQAQNQGDGETSAIIGTTG